MSTHLDWSRDGIDWPNRDSSRFVRAGGIEWHVQVAGEGPPLLLLHGTGASTHSWSTLLPLLARDHLVVAPDLPGHGFSSARPSGLASLPWMAKAIGALLRELRVENPAIVGHSAGAAVAVRMALDRIVTPPAIVAIGGALLPFPGMAQHLFPAIAKVLFLNPIVPRLMAWRAQAEPNAVERLIGGTGSTIDARQMAFYARLFRDPRHCDAALAMMANWDLTTLERDLPRLAVPLTLLVGENDRFVPLDKTTPVANLVPDATIVTLPGLGHLAHEEDAAVVESAIRAALTRPAGPPGAAT